jgi:hypothetical protein
MYFLPAIRLGVVILLSLYRISLRSRRSDDRSTLEDARRLGQDAAFKGGASHERNARLDQKDTLHVRTCANRDLARDLPEDVLRKCAARQDHILVSSLNQVSRRLNNKDVGACAFDGDVTGEVDVRAEGVDTGRQCNGVEAAGSEVDPCDIGVITPRGVIVRGLHVPDRDVQTRRNVTTVGVETVVRRNCLAAISGDLRGRPLMTFTTGEAEASHGSRADG